MQVLRIELWSSGRAVLWTAEPPSGTFPPTIQLFWDRWGSEPGSSCTAISPTAGTDISELSLAHCCPPSATWREGGWIKCVCGACSVAEAQTKAKVASRSGFLLELSAWHAHTWSSPDIGSDSNIWLRWPSCHPSQVSVGLKQPWGLHH